MIYDGKTYRNLEGQVGYLTDVLKQLDDRITDVAANIPSKMIVSELPETGDPNITYYVGPKGTEPNLYYEVWVWVQEEEEGPFVWRELEDTDQVDLSGYLPIQNGVTTYPQVYGKDADGTQGMVEYSSTVRNAALVQRNGSGQILCADPTADSHAVNRGFANQNYRGKLTGATTNAQAYVKFADGTQGGVDIVVETSNNSIVRRTSTGQVSCADPTTDNHAMTKGYADGAYLAKNTAASSYFQAYCKNTDGTQAMCNANASVVGGALPLRRSNGNLAVPLTPAEAGDATSKSYVDAVVGQLLYLHQIEILVTIGLTNTLKIIANLVNGSPTAITTISSGDFVRMNVQYGAILEEGQPATPVSVVKHPTRFVYGSTDAPAPGYAYTIENLGSPLTNFTTDAMTTTVTDTVISW